MAAVLSACATTTGTPVGSTTSATEPVGGLLGALAKVRATEQTAALVEYGDVAAVRDLMASDERFRTLAGFGYSDIATAATQLAEQVGIDPRAAGEAVRVGRPPTWAGVLRVEVDVAAVNGRFDGFGAKRADEAGATTWITAGDDEVESTGPFARMGVVSGFNKVRVAADSVAYAPSGRALTWVVDAGGSTLAGHEVVGALAACLGDVVAAVLTTTPTPLAAGVRRSGEEVACATTDDPAAARGRVGAKVSSPTAPRGGRPWTAVLPDARVEVPTDRAGVVRVVAPTAPGVPVGRVVQALQRNELAALFS